MSFTTNLLHWIRLISLTASAMWGMACDNPEVFRAKVVELLRTSNNSVGTWCGRTLAKVGRTRPSKLRQDVELGLLSKVIKTADLSKRPDRLIAQQAADKLTQLRRVIPQGNSIGGIEHDSDGPRVLFFLTNSEPFTHSGYTLRSQKTLTALRNHGIRVEAVTRLGYPIVVGKLPRSRVQVVEQIAYHRILPWIYPASLGTREDLAVQKLVQVARECQADILHTTTDFQNAIVTARAAEELHIPWVYEVRGELENTWLSRHNARDAIIAKSSEFYELSRKQETQAMNAASAVVALSEVARQRMIARGVDPGKITVVPNAVDEKAIDKSFDRGAIRAELGLPDGQIVGTVTSVVDYEGLDTLLRAIEPLENVTCLIVGEGIVRPKLEKLASDIGIKERVLLVGQKPTVDIWKWYAALDLFVVPRKDLDVTRSVTPIKTLMAQALGVPIVASDLPALREITGNLEVYVEPENHEVLGAAIRKCLDNPRESDSTRWVKSHTWDRNAEILQGIYTPKKG
ncbi:glycosyltransferase [Corynebacterium sp. S7]